MTTLRISRVIATLASVLFTGLALAIWVAPEQAAHSIGLESTGTAGTAVLRADLGGLFAGMALLCAAAAWTLSRSWALAAASVLGAIVVGRSLGWISGGIGHDVAEFAIELGLIVALIGLVRASEAPATPSPRTRRGRLALSALLVATVAAVAALINPGLQQRLFARAAAERASTVNLAPLAEDALRVAICGSSAPLPSADRAKACVAVFAGGKFYIVDVGPESVENLVLWGIPLSSVGGVLLTHFHSDHIGDLGELNLQTWAGGRKAPLQVYGGPGIDRVVVGFNDAYRPDQGYRTAHHTERVMPSATWPMIARTVEMNGPETAAKDRSAVVIDNGTLKITAFEVDHSPISPAYAYRFDYQGRSVLITGDLKYHRPLVKAADGVDLMVSEAISLPMTRALGQGATDGGRSNTAAIMHDIEDYHITPEQAATIANEAKVKLLAFYHLLPAPDGYLPKSVFGRGINTVREGAWTLADDGSLYTMPFGSDVVSIGSVLK